MRARSRGWLVPLVLSLAGSGCGGSDGSGAPDAGGGNLLSLAGSYPTTVTLQPGSTCSGVTVQDDVTTVTHTPGALTLSLGHAGVSYSGTVDTAANFQTSPKTVTVSPAQYLITISGHFTTTGLDATVTVEQTVPTQCAYTVRWVGTKSGPPNVIPG